ncbi:Intracellular septation protein A [Ralstonia sp. 25mfcol4.1]|uniref:septation protein IspZ n=1 Tax=Burkholderiaceae TaxID=119060 RepID=UPI0008805FB1|nr:septation protein IspZ [Ralstonia sp. 25mfcol4.1]SDP38368.1 Intracellular septation protein A [Ralstonia sp. 25mfcol4.1]
MSRILRVAWPVMLDTLGVLVFAVLMALNVDVRIATLAGLVVALAVVGREIVHRRRVAVLQWISLASVVVSSIATWVTSDPRFVMAKPSILFLVIGVVMLRGGWMNRYVPPAIAPRVQPEMTFFGYAWAVLMLVSAALNAGVAIWHPASWPAFIAIYPAVSKGVLFCVQYGVVKAALRQRPATDADADAGAAPDSQAAL